MEEFKKYLLNKKHNFEMVLFLKLIVNFLDDNNIRYYLAGGTLLGAIRNNGIIPWDDDIDICILEEDENKLNKLIITAINYGIELIYQPTGKTGKLNTFIMYPIYKTEYTIFCDVFIYKNTGNNIYNFKEEFYAKLLPGREITLNDFLNSKKKRIYDFEVNIIDNYERHLQNCFKNYNELCIIYPMHTNSSIKKKLTFQGTNYASYKYEINLEELNSRIEKILTTINEINNINFDVNFYRQNNEDISWYTDDALTIHWIKYGYYEGRKSHS